MNESCNIATERSLIYLRMNNVSRDRASKALLEENKELITTLQNDSSKHGHPTLVIHSLGSEFRRTWSLNTCAKSSTRREQMH